MQAILDYSSVAVSKNSKEKKKKRGSAGSLSNSHRRQWVFTVIFKEAWPSLSFELRTLSIRSSYNTYMQNWQECEWTHAHSWNVYATDFGIVFLTLFRGNLATVCSTAVLQFCALPSAARTHLGSDLLLLTEIQIPNTYSNVFFSISQWKLNSFYSRHFLRIFTSTDKSAYPFHSMGKNRSPLE